MKKQKQKTKHHLKRKLRQCRRDERGASAQAKACLLQSALHLWRGGDYLSSPCPPGSNFFYSIDWEGGRSKCVPDSTSSHEFL